EAGKAVKYADESTGGAISEHEALKFVTLNPAKQLGIAERVGSIEVGKDADLVVWSGNPLSSLSRPLYTFVDGRLMFSVERDQQLREQNAAHRARIMQKLLTEGQKPRPATNDAAEADGMDDTPARMARLPLVERMKRAAVRDHMLDLLQRGIDPAMHSCGDCGVSTIDAMLQDALNN
ncbi:MAG: amidohydrolase family protein, partial [Planctomycetota bacterium]